MNPNAPISALGAALLRQLAADRIGWRQLPTSSATIDFLRGGTDCQSGTKVSYTFFLNEKEQRIRGLAHFGTHTEGPKGCVHGGASAALLDVAMGSLCWWTGMASVTGTLNIRYRKLLPLETTVMIDSWIVAAGDGRRSTLAATLTPIADETSLSTHRPSLGQPHAYAEADAIFFRMSRLLGANDSTDPSVSPNSGRPPAEQSKL